jgi:hypothetical protein
VCGYSVISLHISLTCFVNFIRDASLQKKKKLINFILTFSFCLKYFSKFCLFNIIQEPIIHILCSFIDGLKLYGKRFVSDHLKST